MIRDVQLKDINQINDIYNYQIKNSTATFDEEIYSLENMEKKVMMISKKYPYIVFEEENNVVAFCYVNEWKSKAAYKSTVELTVYVSPENHGKGIGYKLMDKIIEKTKDSGFITIISCVTEGNTASDKLHNKFGFEKVSHFRKVGKKFDKWLDVIDYELILK